MGLTDIVKKGAKDLGLKIAKTEAAVGLPILALGAEIHHQGLLSEAAQDWKYLAGIAAVRALDYAHEKWKAYKGTASSTSACEVAPYRA